MPTSVAVLNVVAVVAVVSELAVVGVVAVVIVVCVVTVPSLKLHRVCTPGIHVRFPAVEQSPAVV